MTPEQFFEAPTGVMTCEQAHNIARLSFLAGKVCASVALTGEGEFDQNVIKDAAKWQAFYDSQKVTA